MKAISAGLLLTDNNHILVCHSTGNNFWDIPKGHIEDGETPLQACIREVKEETNLDISNYKLTDLGIHLYTKNKNLYLFISKQDSLPAIEDMACTSTFISSTGKELAEVNKFKYIELNEIPKYCTANMSRVLLTIFNIKN